MPTTLTGIVSFLFTDSEDKFTAAWEAGLKMMVEEAWDLALNTVEEM